MNRSDSAAGGRSKHIWAGALHCDPSESKWSLSPGSGATLRDEWEDGALGKRGGLTRATRSVKTAANATVV
jgi:hypothetical protein